MGSVFIVGAVAKIVSVCGVGLGTSAMLKFFHEYEFKFINNKKGDKNDTNHSESLRERAKGLS